MSERGVGFGPWPCIEVGPDETREQIIAKGVKPEAADELIDFRRYLIAKSHGERRPFKEWRAAQGDT